MSKTEFSPILRTRSAIASTAIKNGQLLASTDTGECFVDVNNARVQIGDIIKVPSAEALPIAPVTKLYFSEADLCFFYPTYVDGDLVWEPLKAAENTEQYQDITASDGVLTITTTKIPVAVEINSYVYIPKGMTRNETTFTIPVAPILAEANLASFDGAYRVWLS